MLESRKYNVSNGAGWRLFAKRSIDPEHFNPKLRPVAAVPGYGMNSFIIGFHPGGQSMEEYLTAAGFEVWTMNLRGQDFTFSENGGRLYGIRDVARVDLPAILGHIVETTQSRRRTIDILGCSLGGTYVFAYAVLNKPNPLGNIVALGAPLRWEKVHPALRLAFCSPELLGKINMRGTRLLCRIALPLAAKIPGLLHIYLHPEIVDISQAGELVKTIEDPNPLLNREIAEWVGRKDLLIDGINISEAFREITNPLLCIQANADGVVPMATAFSALELASSTVKDTLIAGTDEIPMAHADMYISRYAQDLVFQPLAEWLLAHQG
ncbi:MAG: alpha/beta fold hydrolase [Candidatus Lernaella stagnicola]|nr:alpha/beta fold hydrolase [Candidatus Lernaella stagnicola]